MCISMMKNCSSVSVYVVVNFLSQVIFVSFVFGYGNVPGMLFPNEVETKEK